MQGGLIADLGIVLTVAAVTGTVARRFGQPSLLGYLFAGLLVGPYLPVPLFADPHRMEELAELGVVLVMLVVGLEFRLKRLLQILPLSGVTAVVQIGTLSWAGFSLGGALGWSTAASITLGACLAISSTMVVGAVLRDTPIDPDARAHVFGVLVVQDVVAIVLIAVVTALAAGEALEAAALGTLMVELMALVVGLLTVALLVLPVAVRWVQARFDAEALVVLVAGAGFGCALAAQAVGFSAALGAFLAGMALAEAGRTHAIEEAVEPLRAVFSALFFVSIGMSVDPAMAWEGLPLALTLTALVVGLQLGSVVLGSLLSGNALRRSVVAGLALGQIGELSFILATIAAAGGVVGPELVPALVTVATITAFTTPLLLRRADRVVSALDRLLPDRAHRLLGAWQALLRRMQTPGSTPPLRRHVRAVVLDWLGLVALVVVRLTVGPTLGAELAWAADLALLIATLPLLVGLVASGRRIVLAVRAGLRRAADPTPTARALEAVALTAVVVGVGAPTMAVLRPLIDQPLLDLAAVAVVGGLAALLAARTGKLEGSSTSGVARLAKGLVRHAEGEAAPAAVRQGAGPLAGLDYTTIALEPGAEAAGKTLAQLDLRCRTGATVVAIDRAGTATILPTGHEPLAEGDLLAVSGSAEALARARALLVAGPRASSSPGA